MAESRQMILKLTKEENYSFSFSTGDFYQRLRNCDVDEITSELVKAELTIGEMKKAVAQEKKKRECIANMNRKLQESK